MEDTWEPEEICKDDPEKDECIKVFESLNEIAEMNLWDVGAAFSALLFLLSIPRVFPVAMRVAANYQHGRHEMAPSLIGIPLNIKHEKKNSTVVLENNV